MTTTPTPGTASTPKRHGQCETCRQAMNEKALGGQPCAGPMYVYRRYFVDGSDLFMCEKHAKASMIANPLGPRYVPVKK